MAHGFGGKELAFFYVYHLAGACGGYYQIGLTAKECRYLEYIHILCGHAGFFGSVYVGHYRYIECFAHFAQYFKSLYVADACERVYA